jgi:hypothetical protein
MRRSTVLSFPLQLVFPGLRLAYLAESDVIDLKTCSQCYKTFYGRKLQLFIIS